LICLYNAHIEQAYLLLTWISSYFYCLLTRRSFAMNEKGPMPLTVNSPTDARWDLVRRVADSVYFRKGPKLRAFLLYVCENTILGRPENVREQLIGSKVFGRITDYNLSDDNIVRVEARELRKRLEAYFASEGKDEAVVIEIPKGAYVPVFRPREGGVLPPAAPELEEPVEAATVPLRAEGHPTPWLAPALAVGLLISLAATLWLLAENRRLRQTPASMDTGARVGSQDYALYADLLGSMGSLPNREPRLVLCNPKVILFFGAMTANPQEEPAGSYLPASKDLERIFSPAFNGADRDMPFHFFQITNEKYTGNGEATAAFHLGRLMDSLHRSVHITQPRFLNWDNIQQEDVILLGGPSANDWSRRIDPQPDFAFAGRSVVNARPMPGEPEKYTADDSPRAGGAMSEYGFLKMHTNPDGFRNFLLAGLSGGGTAGVAEFFATPAKVRVLAERIGAVAPGKPFPSDWEGVIRITVQDGLPVETSLVTTRPVRPPAH
jgi:hypothetical protein